MELELNNKKSVNLEQEKQNNFLESTLGKTINGALDIGLRWILPDLIENQVIEIKDTLLNNGLKEGIDKSIDVAIDFGKSAYGIVTGKFDNISQIQTVVQKGGMLDTISDSLDKALNYAIKKEIMPRSIVNIIKNGKNTLLNNIESNLQNTITDQIKGIEKIETSITNWNTYLKQENFEKMELEYNKVKKQLKELIPLETTLKKARELENLHLLIKNRGGKMELSGEEKELSKKLS